MSKLRNYFNKPLIVCMVVLFIILSYFKLYTVQVTFSNDPTVSIVKTHHIQWVDNTYRLEKDTLPYNWYDDYGFKILYADEMGHIWQTIHSFSIIIWWIILFFLVVSTIILIIKI